MQGVSFHDLFITTAVPLESASAVFRFPICKDADKLAATSADPHDVGRQSELRQPLRERDLALSEPCRDGALAESQTRLLLPLLAELRLGTAASRLKSSDFHASALRFAHALRSVLERARLLSRESFRVLSSLLLLRPSKVDPILAFTGFSSQSFFPFRAFPSQRVRSFRRFTFLAFA